MIHTVIINKLPAFLNFDSIRGIQKINIWNVIYVDMKLNEAG